jgi:hypothetical protein
VNLERPTFPATPSSQFFGACCNQRKLPWDGQMPSNASEMLTVARRPTGVALGLSTIRHFGPIC